MLWIFLLITFAFVSAQQFHVFNADGSGSDVVNKHFEDSSQFSERFNKMFPKTLCVRDNDTDVWECFCKTDATFWVTDYEVVTDAYTGDLTLRGDFIYHKKDIFKEMTGMAFLLLQKGLNAVDETTFDEMFPILSSQFPEKKDVFYRTISILREDLTEISADGGKFGMESIDDFLKLIRQLALNGLNDLPEELLDVFPGLYPLLDQEFVDTLFVVKDVVEEMHKNQM